MEFAFRQGSFLSNNCHTKDTSCRKNVMHEKWGPSGFNGFETKMIVKSNTIFCGSKKKVVVDIPSFMCCRGIAGRTLYGAPGINQGVGVMALLFTIAFMSKLMRSDCSHFSCIKFCQQMVCLLRIKELLSPKTQLNLQ